MWVTASYFSHVPARARHFLIETADETAVDEAASLNQNKPDPEVGSLNGLNRQLDYPPVDIPLQFEFFGYVTPLMF